jgi:cob(I)alamin adenosyltransferase
MRIYTKSGDEGETSLFAGPRVRKDHPRVEAYGTVDELNAVLGLARSEGLPEELDGLVTRIQHELLVVGAQLATAADSPGSPAPALGPEQVSHLEQSIDQWDRSLPTLRQFILPGGTRASAALHVARTVCRRAERRVVKLAGLPEEQLSPYIRVYLNRLGDLLFVLARAANASAGQADVVWRKPDESVPGGDEARLDPTSDG